MRSAINQSISSDPVKVSILGLGIVGVLVAFLGLLLDNTFLVVAPVGVVILGLTILDYRWIFLLVFAFIPLSIETELPGGFGTDLPTEPLMLILMGVALLVILRKAYSLSAQILLHPISILLLLHYSWLWVTSLFSENTFVSIKFCLAKTWYILAFYFLSIIILRSLKFQRTIFRVTGFILLCVTSLIIYRHSLEGFSFASSNFVVGPFFRNHVNSAATMVVMAPFVVYLLLKSKLFLERLLWAITLCVLVAGIYFSYTRAAHLCIFIGIATTFIIYKGWMKYALGASLIGAIFVFSYILNDNKYLDYAPDYDTTVSHTEFGDLVSATYQGKDISTMERVYRWVAGYEMIQRKPYLGFGPGNFYNFYKSYTITNFRTYVSANPEKSGIHSYYLMTLVEQGFVGLIIFLLLAFYALLKFEIVFHQCTTRDTRLLVMSAAICFVSILAFQIINDLIETDKVGPFFFLCLAILFIADMKNKGLPILLDEEVEVE